MPTSRAQILVKPVGAVLTFDKRQLKKTMRQAGAEVAAVAKRLIRSSQGGSGQPPVSRTGNLLKGFRVVPFRSGDGVAVKNVAASPQGFPYAVALEGGAQGGGRGMGRIGAHHKGKYQRQGSRVVLPHPFLSLALEQREPSIATRVQAAVVQGIAFKRVKP